MPLWLRNSRLLVHAPLFILIWFVLSRLNVMVEPLMSYYLALAAMYATAMFGMVILVGLSGQVSLGNGALMAVGGYVFAVTSLNWQTVPILGMQWNAVWSVIFAGLGGVIAGLIIGMLAARLRGPYLAGLTLGIAVGLPSIAARFPGLLGGSQGLMLTVPYPEGGYAADTAAAVDAAVESDAAALEAALSGATASPSDAAGSEDMLTVDDVTGSGSTEDMLTPSDVTGSTSPDDMLTVDDVTGSGSTDDLLTPSDVTGSISPDDMLTVDDVTGAGSGASAEPLPVPSASAISSTPSGTVTDVGFVLEQWQASVSIAVACIAGFVALNLVRGRQGRVWKAVRDDPIAAALSGISPAASKVSAFVVSSLFAALAGAVFAQILTYVGPGAYGVALSLSLLVGVVLGGRGSLMGAVIGAVLLVGLPVAVSDVSGERGWSEQVTNNLPTFAYGLLLVLVVLIAPGGVMGLLGSGWRRLTTRR
jgi:ABC-type branched-subunit amino acid transport system permease subunit